MLTNTYKRYIIYIEKGKTLNGYAKIGLFLDSPNFGRWGLSYFLCKYNQKNNHKYKYSQYMFSHCNHHHSWLLLIRIHRGWHNRPAFTLFSVLPLSSDYPTDAIISYHIKCCKNFLWFIQISDLYTFSEASKACPCNLYTQRIS